VSCFWYYPNRLCGAWCQHPLSLSAAGWLWWYRHQPQQLKPALVLSVGAVLLHGLGMSAGFLQLALGQ